MISTTHITTAIVACAAIAAIASPSASAGTYVSSEHGVSHLPAVGGATATSAAAAPRVTFGGSTSQDWPTVVDVPKGHRKATVSISWYQDCGASGGGFGWDDYTVPVSRKGAFSVKRTVDGRFDDGWSMEQSYALKGKVGKSAVTGTFSVHAVTHDPSGQLQGDCSTPSLRFKARDAGAYGGRSSAGAPVVVEMNARRTAMSWLAIPWTADCQSGNAIWQLTTLHASLSSTGGFSGTVNETMDMGGGSRSVQTETLRGRVSARKVVGSWRVDADIRDANDQSTDRCTSGPVTFSLR